MRLQRRVLIRSLFTAAAVLAVPRWLLAARPDAAFDADNSETVVKDLFDGSIAESDQITLKVPDIAENGAVVPVTVSTTLADVESISVMVDNNPTPLVALFELSPQSIPDVSIRIKMGESSVVRTVVKAGGKFYSASKEVKVTIGGCGG
ncbi:MAG: thiosulfate oxidation carrier protein SoxY [Xanthomonadales bacterium]|nr:thiosulfate oxidation carrier protein SoxY [Xanthomonadales bacterium]